MTYTFLDKVTCPAMSHTNIKEEFPFVLSLGGMRIRMTLKQAEMLDFSAGTAIQDYHREVTDAEKTEKAL